MVLANIWQLHEDAVLWYKLIVSLELSKISGDDLLRSVAIIHLSTDNKQSVLNGYVLLSMTTGKYVSTSFGVYTSLQHIVFLWSTVSTTVFLYHISI